MVSSKIGSTIGVHHKEFETILCRRLLKLLNTTKSWLECLVPILDCEYWEQTLLIYYLLRVLWNEILVHEGFSTVLTQFQLKLYNSTTCIRDVSVFLSSHTVFLYSIKSAVAMYLGIGRIFRAQYSQKPQIFMASRCLTAFQQATVINLWFTKSTPTNLKPLTCKPRFLVWELLTMKYSNNNKFRMYVSSWL